MSKESQFFGSLDSVYSRSKSSSVSSAHDHGFINVTEHLDILRRAFSTEVMEKHHGEEGTKRHIVSNTLNHEEMMKMDFYSKFTPTSVTLSHFLDHSSGGGSVEDSFVFLRREIPVRLANMMMELEVLLHNLNT